MPFKRTIDLPAQLYAQDTGAPFDRCISCDRPLLEPSTSYIIERGVRHIQRYGARETIFEYAMCMACHGQLWQAFSEDSRRRIEAYFAEHAEGEERIFQLLATSPDDLEAWLGHCVVDGTPVADLDEYQLVAQGEGDQLVLSYLPCVVGGPAIEAMSELLSAKTRNDLRGFIDDHFGLPPELRALFLERGTLMI